MIPPAREHILAALPGELAAAARREARRWAPVPARPDPGTATPPTLAVPARQLAREVSPATLRGYVTDWRAFTAWCSMHQLTVPPARAEEVAVYLAAAACAAGPADGSPRYRPATLLRWASSISAMHTTLALPDPCTPPPARQVITAIRAIPRDGDRTARPLLAGDLLALLAYLPPPGWPGEPARRRDRLIVTLGFSAALSPSGLTSLALADLSASADQHTLKVRQAPVSPGATPLACPACAYASWRELIDAAGTTGAAGVRELMNSSAPEPVTHTRRLPRDAGGEHGQLPLLRRIRRGGTITAEPLTAQVITQVLRRLAARAGLDPASVTGLSLRASGRLHGPVLQLRFRGEC
jgi:integrase